MSFWDKFMNKNVKESDESNNDKRIDNYNRSLDILNALHSKCDNISRLYNELYEIFDCQLLYSDNLCLDRRLEHLLDHMQTLVQESDEKLTDAVHLIDIEKKSLARRIKYVKEE